MTDWLIELFGRIRLVIEAGVVVFASVVVVQVWLRTRQFAPTLGAVVFAALVIWAVRNTDVLADLIGREFQ